MFSGNLTTYHTAKSELLIHEELTLHIIALSDNGICFVLGNVNFNSCPVSSERPSCFVGHRKYGRW